MVLSSVWGACKEKNEALIFGEKKETTGAHRFRLYLMRVTLRKKLLGFISTLIGVSVFVSLGSLYRITEVNRTIDTVNQVYVPFGKLLTQLQSDSQMYHREFERRLAYLHWADTHWRPRAMPNWINEVISAELVRARVMVESSGFKGVNEGRADSTGFWSEWLSKSEDSFARVRRLAAELPKALDERRIDDAKAIHSELVEVVDQWMRDLQWGGDEFDRVVKRSFQRAESVVSQLKAALQIILIGVVALSLLVLLVVDRALRPLVQVTALARTITQRGLKREDKRTLESISLRAGKSSDEVSQLGNEFYRMATSLLEREKEIQSQSEELSRQNGLLRQMGGLNENILRSIRTPLIVTDEAGRITQINTEGRLWLGERESQIGCELLAFSRMKEFQKKAPGFFEGVFQKGETSELTRIDVSAKEAYEVRAMSLRGASGAVFLIENITAAEELERRLKQAESLASIGRLSAQVAHEVRNPLHSIGLEAEIALEAITLELAEHKKLSRIALAKESLNSIMGSVDRLGHITDNYLKLSKLSSGKLEKVSLTDVLESTLATYSLQCQRSQVRVEWGFETPFANDAFAIMGDKTLLEQVIGNLIKNSLQAFEGKTQNSGSNDRSIKIVLSRVQNEEVRLLVSDSGPGIPDDFKEKLFVPFSTTKAQGTGLGLSFCRKVIEDHYGSMQLFETDKSTGACFELKIPALVENWELKNHQEQSSGAVS